MKTINWYISKTNLWGRSLLELDATDQLLVGYPKTGSTWIRYYLYALLSQKVDGLPATIDAMNSAMPEFAHTSIFQPWLFEECARIIKTHQCGMPFLRNKRAALIVRDPRDIVVSYYHYASGLKSSGFNGSISDVLRHPKMGAESFFKHYASWSDHAGLILRYEDLKDDPSDGFSRLAAYYEIERSSEAIQHAIDASNFSNMRTAQQKSDKLKGEFKEGHQFVRSGKNAEWEELFSEDDIAYYENLKTKYNFNLYD